jgi:hypothetical protein
LRWRSILGRRKSLWWRLTVWVDGLRVRGKRIVVCGRRGKVGRLGSETGWVLELV